MCLSPELSRRGFGNTQSDQLILLFFKAYTKRRGKPKYQNRLLIAVRAPS